MARPAAPERVTAAPSDAAAIRPPRRSERIAQALVSAILYAVPALFCLHAATVSDPDVWWHLRSGEWMLQHHAVPHTDPFSSFAAGKPWSAYSWIFEILIAKLFQHLGLIGIVTYTTGMVLATTAALHHLIKRLQADFTLGVLLTLVACLSMGRLDTPRPWHFTILFFVLELDILMHARRTGRLRELAWLPLIFALWANLHIQFVNGLILLALALAEAIAARWWPAAKTRLSLRGAPWLAITVCACGLATLLNPYGWHIYKVAHDLAAQPGVINHITELQAIPFRGLPDYCVLLLAVAAIVTLARCRQLRPFETALLAFALLLSFRSQRDVWMMAAAAGAIVASGSGTLRAEDDSVEHRRTSASALGLGALLLGTILFAAVRILHIDNAALRTQLAANLPVDAVKAIQAVGYKGPIFNDYGWGGYLMWSLRQPVSIDGRAAFQGTERLDRFNATWSAEPDWANDKELAAAGIVIGPVKSPLMQVLRLDPRYRLAYADKVAAVYVPAKAAANTGR